MLQSSTTVLEFWFGHDVDDTNVAKQQAALWWSKDAAVDAHITQLFSSTVDDAASGALNAWDKTALGRLALILLTDQLPRNMYRGTAQAFAYDPLSRAWCKAGLTDRQDLQLQPIQQVFFYLPLEHSENRADQALSVQLFGELAAAVLPQLTPIFDGYLNFARRHQDIIERFGRFPHRNQLLQRESTKEELVFLQQPGSGF